MDETKIVICSRDAAFAREAARFLALWQESYCVRCAAERVGWEDFPAAAGRAAICLLDLTEAGGPGGTEPRLPREAATVIVSSSEDRAIQAYRWHPTACLPAAFGYAEFCEAMDQCFPLWRHGLQWLELPFHREQVRLPLCQLRYAEAEGRETLLYCAGGMMRSSISLGRTEEQLPSPPFLRCQKSFLVHIGAIRELSGGNVVMSDGQIIPMARERARELTDAVRAWNAARGTEVKVS